MYTNRRNNAEGTHTKGQWLKKLKEFDRCPKCKRIWERIPARPDKRYKYVWTKDHIIPLNKSGTDDIDNIQPLCYQCNFGKR
ncbi:HNH endonuclease signature motif containing protein [Fulvivirgaceae bacterium LMO-SS25]